MSNWETYPSFEKAPTMPLATIMILTALIGQTAKVDERLEFMKTEAAAYHLGMEGNRGMPLKFQEEPAFRLGKQPADDVEDGAIFFWVDDFFKDKTWSTLRLLPTPVARYGKEGSAVIGGALFAFAIGTDPEVCVFLEVRQGNAGPEWFYAMGPLTCFSVKGTYKNKEVWDLRRRNVGGDPKACYYITVEKL